VRREPSAEELPCRPHSGPPITDVVIVRSPKNVRQLTTELRDPQRSQPVIGLDANAAGTAPVVSPRRLGELLDPRARIYFIETPAMRSRLEQRLGRDLVPINGIRIWWPGLTPEGNPGDHPLVTAGPSEEATLNAFMLALDRSRPTLHSLYAQLNATARQLTETEQRLRTTQQELTQAKRATEEADEQRNAIDKRLAAIGTLGMEKLDMLASMDDEESMHFSIFTEWLGALTAADRQTNPFGGYVFGPRFLATVDANRAATSMDRIAFVCAMVSCGRAERLSSLKPQPLPDVAQTHKRRRNERPDGAKGWLCVVAGATRLVYWTLPGGRIEFDSVQGHDRLSRS
jgi:hypothetical protein